MQLGLTFASRKSRPVVSSIARFSSLSLPLAPVCAIFASPATSAAAARLSALSTRPPFLPPRSSTTARLRAFATSSPRPRSDFDSNDIDSHNSDNSNMASKEKAKPAVALKTPKGTRDWTGADMILRDEIFQTISDVFKRHGGVPLDTPVFELKEVLAGKYGEDSRLIYDLADQGGELTALRYDLTVPFARWLAMNKVQQFRRFQIAKVYRRDQPAVARGRMREFFQCDFDIAGTYDRMIPDAEIVRVVHEVFSALPVAPQGILIKLNHRQILDGLFAVAGVPADKIRAISSAVDKLDKLPWPDVKQEMVDEKGLDPTVADRIGTYVQHAGPIADIAAWVRADATLMANPSIQQGVADMDKLAAFLDAFGVPTATVSFDLSLCRGLDYYTGLIFEVVIPPAKDAAPAAAAPSKKKKSEEIHVGSIAAGGRYDNLVGMYGKTQIPCVGISFGVDRIFTLLKARREAEAGGKPLRVRETDVYVMAFGAGSFDGLLPERMRIARQLWDAGIKAEFAAKTKPRLPQQFKAAEDVPLGVILGEDELAQGQVRLKRLNTGAAAADADDTNRGQLVAQDDLVAEIKKLLIQ